MEPRRLSKAQRVSIPEGGFSLRGVIDGWFIHTAKVVEEPEPDLFKTEVGRLYRIDHWSPPSKPTSEYENIPADWPVPPKQ
ncbi:hypothetical protein SAMN05444163_8166 [Bradyrhizobium ottawaense]|uniref:Uncharacterized protein n=2 Tax=Bradyrhizobium ottawaense TaxID=931866 RepID=A0ABY0QHH2_9BRAD|nr:hypothetical protein SAMN05444163_0006 [Bradyrhizobium ottawaense]SDK46015.1 hypothetical protein SAMN05444163_8166 [Bradyrhizobium ottawaense]